MSRALISPPSYGNPQNLGSTFAQGSSHMAESAKLDVFDLLKRKFAFISFFVLIGIGLGLLYFFKVPKTFESTAKIFVDEKNAPSVNTNEDLATESPVEKYIEIIRSSKILKPAIAAGNFARMATFKKSEDVLFDLREEDFFEVMPADTKAVSGVISLSFKGATAEECKLALEHIVDSFNEHIQSTTKNLGGETVKLVERMQDQMSGRMSEVEIEIQKLIAKPELSSNSSSSD